MAVSFLDLTDAVASYYGAGSDQWVQIAQYGINSPQAIEILKQVPGVNLTVSNSGKILGWDYNNAFGASLPPASTIDSNVQSGTYGAGSFTSNIPSSAVAPSASLPDGGMSSGAKLTATGNVLATVADRISLAAAGVALGTKLGKLIDSGIYALNPDWFDDNFPTINPETWDDMATTQGGKQFIRSIFGLQNDEATMYLDERLLAQAYMMYLANGAYSNGGIEISPPVFNVGMTITEDNILHGTLNEVLSVTATATQIANIYNSGRGYTGNEYCLVQTIPNYINILFLQSPLSFNATLSAYIAAQDIYTFTRTPLPIKGDLIRLDRNGIDVAYGSTSSPFLATVVAPYTNAGFNNVNSLVGVNITHINPLDGVEDNPQASTYIDPSQITGTDLNTVLQQLKTLYPDLFNGSIYTDVPQDDGTTERYAYIPVPYPNTSNPAQPTSDNTPNINPQTNPQVDPNTRPESAQDIATQLATPTINSPDTGDGGSPTVVPPTGNASSLWAVYNPTQGQVDAFGAWLWSSNFVDQIQKLFADPMQGIIGLHKIFATPATGGAQNIKVGYLDSGVSSAVVTSQYTDIDCGTVNVAEYFGNVFDYEDTQIRLYLPFIGIVDLSTSDVMRSSVQVIYHVDVITGACLADVNVFRDGGGGVLYQYSGDAAVRYPVSSGSYMGMVSGVLAVVGGIASVATGGALAPALMGAASGVMRSKTDVKHSGNFSGAAGAMGSKIPYLIIERPQTAVAAGYIDYQGTGDNRVVTVGSLSGYFKMTDVHTNNLIGATGAEIEQIKTALERGVIQ